jgi:hypothetical protein
VHVNSPSIQICLRRLTKRCDLAEMPPKVGNVGMRT